MSEISISPALVAGIGCVVCCVACIAGAMIFRKRNGNSENPGTVMSIILAIPFFLGLCHLLICFMKKIGATI